MPSSSLLWLALLGCPGNDPGDSGDTDPTDSGDTDTSDPGELAVLDTTRDLTITTCGTLPAAPAGELCSVSGNASSASHYLLEGRVLQPDGVFEGGAVLIERSSGLIQCSGCDCAEQAPSATVTVTCADGAISPGLINAHDHIRYALESPASWGSERYDHRHDWRRGKNEHTELKSSSTNTREAVLYGELRMLLSGATSIAGSISSVDAQGLLRNLDSRSYNEGLGPFEANYATFPLGDQDGTQAASGCGSYDVDGPNALSDRVYLPHIAEGIDAFANNEYDCLSKDGDGGRDLITSKTSIIHGIGVDGLDVADIRASGARLVWSPRSNISLYGDTAPVVTYRNLGVPVALGTDWTPSGSSQMLRELSCADDFNIDHLGGALTDREIWRMATIGGAQALGAEGLLGELLPGRLADIAIYDARGEAGYRAVLDAEIDDVALVLRAGWPLSGDADVVAGLLPSDEAGRCDALDSCLSDHVVCLQDDTGLSLSDLTSGVGGGAYGLFHCGVPTNEPSCEPFRGADDGDAVYPVSEVNDFDGDGILDADDNCPSVFNPGRPMDLGSQADVDGDGEGDACDACPTQADASCDWLDLDGDGTNDDEDNCPNDVNADQTDADGDGLGAACDPCDDYASKAGACPGSVYDVKDGSTAFGASVALQGLVVTAVNERGFFAQLTSDQTGYSGPEYSGVWAYGAGSSLPSVGDVVTIEGASKEWFGQIQLDPVFSVTVTGTGHAAPDPVAVAVADVADGGALRERYEGVVIEVSDVSVSAIDLEPGGGDQAPTLEFELAGGLVVNDYFYLIDPQPSVDEAFTKLTGVLRWANDKSKLEPRSESDVVAGPAIVTSIDPSVDAIEVGEDLVLTVSTPRAVAADTDVAVSCLPANLLTCPSKVVIAAGDKTAIIGVTGSTASNDVVTVAASLNGSEVSADVRVYDDSSDRAVLAIDPTALTLTQNVSKDVTVVLTLPAATGGTVVALASDLGVVGVPADVTVPEGQTTATFAVTSTDTLGADTVTVQADGDPIELPVDVVEKPLGEGLLFSQYIEGSSNNKVLEIHNAGDADLPLDGCKILLYANGKTAASSTIALTTSATLASGDQWVVCHNQQTLVGASDCDQKGNIAYNGNDALELVCGSELQDSFGKVGEDPGDAWGIAVSTKDATLRRGCLVTVGDRVSDDAFDPATEWTATAADDVTGVGDRECD